MINIKEKRTNEQFLNLLKEGNPLFLDNFEILDEYTNSKTKIRYKCKKCNQINSSLPHLIIQSSQCPICKKFFRINDAERRKEKFLQKFKEKGNQEIEVIGEYVDCKTKIKCRCKKYGHEFEVTPDKLTNRGDGCPICNNHRCLDGFNSVADIRPDLIKYFIDEKDAHKYTKYSGKRFNFKCPNCGHIKENTMSISTLAYYGFSCDYCNDKISFPNKMLRNLLINLKENNKIKEWKTEYQPKWVKPYRYDGYLLTNDNIELLIEMDGKQHYQEMKSRIYRENGKEIDDLKDKLANDNGCRIIRIDCRESNFDFIKNNILKSGLNIYVNLDNVDWKQIELNINKNFLIEVCKKYNDGVTTVDELAQEFNCCKATIVNVVKRGAKLGICNYDIKEFVRRKNETKDIIRVKIFDNDNLLVENIKISDAIEFLKTKINKDFSIKGANNSIRKCLKGEQKYYRGFRFEKC